MKALFVEKQRFSQWWIRVILLLLALLPIWICYEQYGFRFPTGDCSMSIGNIILLFLLLYPAICVVGFGKMTTTIDERGIKVRHLLGIQKEIAWSYINSADVVDYGFVGGWGIRFWTKFGTVYNMRGRMGVALKLSNGKKLLIGTQEPERLEEVLSIAKERGWL